MDQKHPGSAPLFSPVGKYPKKLVPGRIAVSSDTLQGKRSELMMSLEHERMHLSGLCDISSGSFGDQQRKQKVVHPRLSDNGLRVMPDSVHSAHRRIKIPGVCFDKDSNKPSWNKSANYTHSKTIQWSRDLRSSPVKKNVAETIWTRLTECLPHSPLMQVMWPHQSHRVKKGANKTLASRQWSSSGIQLSRGN